jgi:hypothetical protein
MSRGLYTKSIAIAHSIRFTPCATLSIPSTRMDGHFCCAAPKFQQHGSKHLSQSHIPCESLPSCSDKSCFSCQQISSLPSWSSVRLNGIQGIGIYSTYVHFPGVVFWLFSSRLPYSDNRLWYLHARPHMSTGVPSALFVDWMMISANTGSLHICRVSSCCHSFAAQIWLPH